MADKKKNVSSPKDNILSDSDDSQADIECETCGISFNDAKTYENHIQGKKHAKRVSEMKLKAKTEKTDDEEEIEAEDSDDCAEIHCKICDKDFSGYVSYAAHVKGSGHAKHVKKQKLKKQLDDMPEVLKRENEENDSDDDGIIPKPYARCDTCQKEFGGPESFKMHVKSSNHLKKVKQAKVLQDLKKDEGEHSDGDEIYSKCKVCSKSFSGVVPYKIHMQSNVHKKNLDKQKIAEEIKEFCDNDESSKGYICKECKKPFTDPLAFKCHLQNNSHEKLKAKNALSEFLHAHPEIVCVAPFDEKESSGNESENDSASLFYLICKLCHMSFSGPESAQDHVKSRKHITTKKEKKMQKLLSDQQKNQSPSSSGDTNDARPSKAASSAGKQVNGSKNDDENGIDEFEVL